MWLVGVGGIYGCGYWVWLYYLSLVSVLFYSSIPTFCSFLNVFFLVPVLFCNYILCLKYFFAQYKHTYEQLRASHGSHMKAAHTVLYIKKHTKNARFISCAGHQLYERSVVSK